MQTSQLRGEAAEAALANDPVLPPHAEGSFSPFGRTHRFHVQLHQLADAALIAVALIVSFLVRRYIGLTGQLKPMLPFMRYAWSYLVVMPTTIYLLDQFGIYKSLSQSPWRVVWTTAKGITLAMLVTVGVAYLLKDEIIYMSRVWILLFAGAATSFIVLKHSIAGYRAARAGERSSRRRAVALVGARQQNTEIAQLIAQHPEWGIAIAVELDLNDYSKDRLAEALHEHHVECVMLTTGKFSFDRVGQTISICETEGVDVWLMADFVRPAIARLGFDQFNERPVLVFSCKPDRAWSLLCKRFIDFFGAVVMLAIAGPLIMLPVAILIRLTSSGPILFRQVRCGLHGKRFTMLKFRSMVANAEEQRDNLIALNEQSGPVFKIARDPRITPIGRIIRKTSIDELPQLLNVLSGHMSLVGPRPPLPSEVQKYATWQRRRLSMKPGLTCLWQVSGRNRIKFEDWMRLDLKYIDAWSLTLDFRILLQTVPAVIRGDGAN